MTWKVEQSMAEIKAANPTWSEAQCRAQFNRMLREARMGGIKRQQANARAAAKGSKNDG